MTWAGVAIRYQTWQRTEALRYQPDMANAWNWGGRAAREGYFGLYQTVFDSQKDRKEKNYGLDYVPLRLGVMTLWAKSRLAQDPAAKSWQPDYTFNAPLLQFNVFMEFMTAVGAFVLVRQWSRRDDRRRLVDRTWLRPEVLALIAFALIWFNPASILSAHARPTWDVWVTPFFVWAIWLGCRNYWLTAGIILAVGTMFKGQQLVVAPIFILWPLMGLRFIAAGRFILGFLLAATLIVSPWNVGPNPVAISFVVAIAVLPVAIYFLLKRRPLRGRSVPGRWLRWTIPLALIIALISAVPLFDGSMAWYDISIVYGANKFKALEVGGASSLAGILQRTYRWGTDDPLLTLPYSTITLTISQAMITTYGLCLLMIAWAMHRFERIGDARFLLAMAAPWIVYFAIFPKMHERYLLWGALCVCAATAVNAGPVLLAIFFSLASMIMSLYQMLPRNRADEFLTELGPDAGLMLHNFVRPTFPDIGWAILMATAVWIWMVVAGAARAKNSLDTRCAKVDDSV